MPKLNDYMMTAEAAKIFGVSQNTLRKYAASRDIPVRRNPANGYRLFKRSDLQAFLKKADGPSSQSDPTRVTGMKHICVPANDSISLPPLP